MNEKAVKFISEMVVGTIVAESIKKQCTNAIMGSMLGFGGGLVASIVVGKVLNFTIKKSNVASIILSRLDI